MIIKTGCPNCDDTKKIYVPTVSYIEWKAGKLIQNCFPHLDADDRERLISGICPECYDKMFGEETAE